MRRLHKAAVVAALALALGSGVARAAQKLGVDVYRKAELLPAESALVRGAIGGDAACYRTTDAMDAVAAYYARMSGFALVEPNVLRRGKVDVVLHPPRPNPRTGAVSRYAVFCIMQATD